MTANEPAAPTTSKRQRAELLLDMLQRLAMHHAMWFAEVRHQLGAPAAYELLKSVSQRSLAIQLKRLAGVLNVELEQGIPKPLLDLPGQTLEALLDGVATNWLANDGIWFQAVETAHGMNDAKRCNDSCWAHFSPFEAWSIRQILDLDAQPGLEGLQDALQMRLYARVNEQSFVRDSDNSLVFQMNNCRVQAARQRKGLDDYPCKSAGLVEYTYFARAIDARIRTECIGCPPDAHPAQWFCSWRFVLDEDT